MWGALALAGAGVSLYFQLGALALCFYAVALLLGLSWAMAGLWLRPLEVHRELADSVLERGETARVFIRVRNRAPYPVLWTYVEETTPPAALVQGNTRRVLFLMPGQSFSLYYAIHLPGRGCHRLGPLLFESGDVFGLFRKCWIDGQADYVTVLPNYRIIEEFAVGRHRRLADLAAERSIFEDPTRLRGVREYRRGDALKRIHWRATAHSGRLCSKVYEPVLEAGATVALDFRREAWPTPPGDSEKQPPEETAVEIACTIARYLSDGGWKVGLVSNGRDPLGLPGIATAQAREALSLSGAQLSAREAPRDDRIEPLHVRAATGSEHFALLRESLGRLALSDGLPIEDAILETLAHIDRQQVLVVLTGEVGEGLVSGLARVRGLGYRIMVFVVRNPLAHERAFEAFVPQGIEVFDMTEDWRLEEIATGRQVY